jgi:hypothetical protein
LFVATHFFADGQGRQLESFVAEEASKILEVSENAHEAGRYEFRLVKFPREDILGLSVGNHRIFMSYELSRLAYEEKYYRWLLRHALAHEIAHDVLGHQSSKHEASLNSVPDSSSRITRTGLRAARQYFVSQLLTGSRVSGGSKSTRVLAENRLGLPHLDQHIQKLPRPRLYRRRGSSH